MKIKKIISLFLCFSVFLTLFSCGEITESAVKFNAQLVRTDTDEGFGKVTIIRSVEECKSFAEQRGVTDLSSALEKYDSNYFKKQILIAVNKTSGSGSITYSVNSFQKSSDGKAYIDIKINVPEAYTTDMAYWYFLIEPEAEFTVEKEEDILISYDGYLKVPLEYEAQYIKTKVYWNFEEVRIIRTKEEKEKFIETNKLAILFKRNDDTVSLEEALKKYDDAYFKKRMLIMVLKENNNKSETPKINSFKKGPDGKVFVNVDWISNGEFEFDEAHWFILIEPEKDFEVGSKEDIFVNYSS